MSTQFKDFTEQDQKVFENYTVNPSRDNFSKLEVNLINMILIV